jgi:hypothetical protein
MKKPPSSTSFTVFLFIIILAVIVALGFGIYEYLSRESGRIPNFLPIGNAINTDCTTSADCVIGLVCDTSSGSGSVCKVPIGGRCSSNNQCFLGNCIFGACAAPNP